MGVSGNVDINDMGTVSDINVTPTRSAQTGVYATAAGLRSVSVTNVGTANGTLLGAPILPGQTVNFEGYFDEQSREFVRLDAIAMVGTGTVLHVVEMA